MTSILFKYLYCDLRTKKKKQLKFYKRKAPDGMDKEIEKYYSPSIELNKSLRLLFIYIFGLQGYASPRMRKVLYSVSIINTLYLQDAL